MFLLLWIDFIFTGKRFKYSHESETCVSNTSNKIHMTYDFFIKKPMQRVELKLNKINIKNPHLVNTLDRNIIQPLNQKNSHIIQLEPFFFVKILFYHKQKIFPSIVISILSPLTESALYRFSIHRSCKKPTLTLFIS